MGERMGTPGGGGSSISDARSIPGDGLLIMDEAAFQAVAAHCAEGYPHEVCGLLVGRAEGDGVKRIVRAERAKNLNTERAHDRYELDPMDWLRVDRSLDGTDLAIVGVYHSHPDHPARPSQTDLERAWPALSYLIVSVEKGTPTTARSWVLNEAAGRFEEETVRLEPGGGS